MAIDPSQRLDRSAVVEGQMSGMFGGNVAAVMRQGRNVARTSVLLSSEQRDVEKILAEIGAWLAGARQRRQREA